MEKKKLIIDRELFLDWYLTESEQLMSEVFDALLIKGSYVLSIESLLNRVEYIPEEILVDNQEYKLDAVGDVDTTDVELIFN